MLGIRTAAAIRPHRGVAPIEPTMRTAYLTRAATCLALALPLLLLASCVTPRSTPIRDGMILHEVFFELSDPSDENVARLIRGCEGLREIPSVAHLATGARHPDFTRDVNQTDFHVGLHVVFADRAAHDVYQEHPVHLEFIERHKDMWASVRVFDYIAGEEPAAEGR